MLHFCSVSDVTSDTFWYYSYYHSDIACGLCLMSSLSLLFWNFTMMPLCRPFSMYYMGPLNWRLVSFSSGYISCFMSLDISFLYFLLSLHLEFLLLYIKFPKFIMSIFSSYFPFSSFESTFWELLLTLFNPSTDF